MRFLSLVGNSFGCSASGERLVSAARDGDFQEAKALLDYNPRLARYSTFGVRNSPLHYSAAQGHHEATSTLKKVQIATSVQFPTTADRKLDGIVSLLLESGVDINLRNYRGQTALMQACQYGHWEVVQAMILFRANIHRADYLNGGTALHLASLNGHTRCIRLLLADYIPSKPDIWNILRTKSQEPNADFESVLAQVINKPADGGITALHMAALNGHVETMHLLLELGASVSEVTVKDGTTIDLIGAGSTPLHYAACGGNAQCCQILIANGANLGAANATGLTPLMVARSWNRHCLDEILSKLPETRQNIPPSPFISLPLMSIIKIARECGWRGNELIPTGQDTCVVCLERRCNVAAEGCDHEFCTRCALYLCSTTSATASRSPTGSIPCPLCRQGIVSFIALPGTIPITKDVPRTSRSLSLCSCSSDQFERPMEVPTLTTPLYNPDEVDCGRAHLSRTSTLRSSFRSLSTCQRFSSMRIHSSLCMGPPDSSPDSLATEDGNLGSCVTRYSRSNLKRTASQVERRRTTWLSSLTQCS